MQRVIRRSTIAFHSLFVRLGGPLRADVDAMNSDGTGVSDNLKNCWRSVKHIPLDESPGEQPHNQANHIFRCSRGCSFGYTSSTMRLADNMCEVADFEAEGWDLESEWDRYTRILQRPASGNPERSFRCTRKQLGATVYRMEGFSGSVLSRGRSADRYDGVDGDDDDDDEGGGDDGAPPADVVMGEQAPAGGAQPGGGPDDAGVEEGPDHVGHGRMVREYLKASIRTYTYISIDPPPPVDGHEVVFPRAFQILAVRVKAVLTDKSTDNSQFLFGVRIQEMEVWRGVTRPGILNIFKVTEPKKVDILEITGVDPDIRDRLCVWSTRASDLAGSTELYNKTVLVPKLEKGLLGPQVPVLCLLDKLKADESTPVRALVNHTAGKVEVYDSRNPWLKRTYYQAIIMAEDLFKAKVTEFRSGRPSLYYRLLMATRADVEPGKTGRHYKEQLVKHTTDPETLALKDYPAVVPAPAILDGSLEDAIVGIEVVADIEVPLPRPQGHVVPARRPEDANGDAIEVVVAPLPAGMAAGAAGSADDPSAARADDDDDGGDAGGRRDFGPPTAAKRDDAHRWACGHNKSTI